MLVALHEEQSDQNKSSKSGEPLDASDTSAMVDDIIQKLESQFADRFDNLEGQIANSDSKQVDDDSNVDSSSLESIIDRFDSLESKLTKIESKTQGAGGPQLSAAKIQERFESLDERLEKITAAIEGQQKLIEARIQKVDSSDIDALQGQFSKMLNRMKQEMAGIKAIQQNPDASAEGDESTSEPNWSQQKQAMLSKYGIDPKHRPDMAPPTEPDPVMETTMADEQLSASLELSPEESVSTDPEEIQKLKEKLNAKLRDAEVKLSIERAKLSQLQAELESKQVDLDRRNTELAKKIGKRTIADSSKSFEEEDGLLDRLKKHLTAKDRKNLDRI